MQVAWVVIRSNLLNCLNTGIEWSQCLQTLFWTFRNGLVLSNMSVLSGLRCFWDKNVIEEVVCITRLVFQLLWIQICIMDWMKLPSYKVAEHSPWLVMHHWWRLAWAEPSSLYIVVVYVTWMGNCLWIAFFGFQIKSFDVAWPLLFVCSVCTGTSVRK